MDHSANPVSCPSHTEDLKAALAKYFPGGRVVEDGDDEQYFMVWRGHVIRLDDITDEWLEETRRKIDLFSAKPVF